MQNNIKQSNQNTRSSVAAKEEFDKAEFFTSFLAKFELANQQAVKPVAQIMTYTFNPNGVEELPPHETFTVRDMPTHSVASDITYDELAQDIVEVGIVPINLDIQEEKEYAELSQENAVESEFFSDVQLNYNISVETRKYTNFLEEKKRVFALQAHETVNASALPHQEFIEYVAYPDSHLQRRISAGARESKRWIDLSLSRSILKEHVTIRPKDFLRHLSHVLGTGVTWSLIESRFPLFFHSLATANGFYLLDEIYREHGSWSPRHEYINMLFLLVMPIWCLYLPLFKEENIYDIEDLDDATLYAILFAIMSNQGRVRSHPIKKPPLTISSEAIRTIMMNLDHVPEVVDLRPYSRLTAFNYIKSSKFYRVFLVPEDFSSTSVYFLRELHDFRICTNFSVTESSPFLVLPTTCGVNYSSYLEYSDSVDLYSMYRSGSRRSHYVKPADKILPPERRQYFRSNNGRGLLIPSDVVLQIFEGDSIQCLLPVLALLNKTYYFVVQDYAGDNQDLVYTMKCNFEEELEEKAIHNQDADPGFNLGGYDFVD